MPTFKNTPLKPVSENPPLEKVQETVINPRESQKNMPSAKPVLKPINPEERISHSPKKSKKAFVFLGAILVIALGIGSGYGLTISTKGDTVGGLKEEKGLKREVETNEISKGTKVGVADESTFKDTAEGTIKQGGLEGEGSHRLIRPGGESQTIYMTSSIIDLDQFVDKKVKVWGETFSSQKAGWLMDVGKLEVLE